MASKNQGRSGKDARWRAIGEDDRQPGFIRGWVEQEENRLSRNRETRKTDPGRDREKEGRSSAEHIRQQNERLDYLGRIESDRNQPENVRNWTKTEMARLQGEKTKGTGRSAIIRALPGHELAHKRGQEAAKGYNYSHTEVSTKADHVAQHRKEYEIAREKREGRSR